MDWEMSKLVARGVLRSRAARRRVLAWLLVVVVGLVALGSWVVDGWLAAAWWRFGLWWLGVLVLTVVMLLLAVFDALAVVGEERGRMRRGDD